MARLHDADLATLLLTSRLVESSASPLRASEYWALVAKIDLAGLLGADHAALVAQLGSELGARVAGLLDRAAAVAFAVEDLEQQGIATIAAGNAAYPARWRDRLGASAPSHIHVAGRADLLQRAAVGIVSDPGAGDASLDVARAAARHAVERQHVVVVGATTGFDTAALTAATDSGGQVVAILADSLVGAARNVAVRRAVVDQHLCLVTPYPPAAAAPSEAAAFGRAKLIYALADITVVVVCDLEQGETWAGAREAIDRDPTSVAVWQGPGAGPGSDRLVAAGGRPLADISRLVAD